ncbi:MAG: hypothetical protein ACREJP_06960, partial [Candidatus Methylomirabilales bacterium]
PQLSKGSGEADHFVAGDTVKASMWVFSLTTGVRVAPSLIATPQVALFRYRPDTDRVQMLAVDETTWSDWAATDAVVFFALAAAAADARLFVRSFSTTTTWTRDMYGLFSARTNGVPTFGAAFLDELGAENRHTGYGVDPLGLALAGIISAR